MKNIYVIDLRYLKPLEEVDKFLTEHRAYLDEGYKSGNLITSGRKNPTTGGIIIGSFESVWGAQDFMKKDPFILAGVAEYKITEFTPVKMKEELKTIFN
jgi:uncharacterized protein YciI